MTINKIYNHFHVGSAMLMLFALAWLTISMPFVIERQKQIVKNSKTIQSQLPDNNNEEESGNPLGSNSEEKAPKTLNNFSEEYLHDHSRSDYLFSLGLQYHKHEDAGIYIAYHGEPLVPPPDQA